MIFDSLESGTGGFLQAKTATHDVMLSGTFWIPLWVDSRTGLSILYLLLFQDEAFPVITWLLLLWEKHASILSLSSANKLHLSTLISNLCITACESSESWRFIVNVKLNFTSVSSSKPLKGLAWILRLLVLERLSLLLLLVSLLFSLKDSIYGFYFHLVWFCPTTAILSSFLLKYFLSHLVPCSSWSWFKYPLFLPMLEASRLFIIFY